MITTISLGNIHHHTQLQIFVLVMRTFGMYSLGNFQGYSENMDCFMTLHVILAQGPC